MKWATVAAVAVAPLALAGSVERDLGFAQRRSQMEMRTEHLSNGGSSKDTKVLEVGGGTTVVIEETILIWVNPGANAATTTMNQAATAAAGSTIQTHTVIVGGAAGTVYTPESINAEIGDMVVFQFESKNHTVTQSGFTTPCVKLADGMDTGFMANVNNTINPPPQMAMQVKVKTPLWYYCRQKGHCGMGMTFSINPTANKTQEMFKQMAIAQNGTGSAAPIVGGSAPPPPPAAATAAAPPPPPAAAPPAAAAPSVAPGVASTGNGACSCSCSCGVSSFPSAAQGLLAVGGMPGAIPMSAMMQV